MKREFAMETNWLSWQKDEVCLKKKDIFIDFNKETTKVDYGKLFSAVGTF